MTEPLAPLPPPGPSSRGLKIALVLSLGVNLGVLGLLGGALLHGRPDGPPRFARDLGFGPFTEALSPEDRRALLREFGRDIGDPRAFRREMRGDLQELLQLLRAEPLDRAALEALFERMNTRGQQRLATGQRLLEERILSMSPEARRAFADRLDEGLRRGPRRDEGPGG